MSKPKYAVIDYPCSDQIIALKRNKVVVMVHGGMDAVVARYGTDKKTLKKLLRKHQHDSLRR